MKRADGCVVANARTDHFSSATKPRHEMWFNKTRRYLDVRLHEYAVDQCRDLQRWCNPQVLVIVVVSGVIVDDCHICRHPRITDQFFQFLVQVGPMQPGGHEYGDVFQVDARGC